MEYYEKCLADGSGKLSVLSADLFHQRYSGMDLLAEYRVVCAASAGMDFFRARSDGVAEQPVVSPLFPAFHSGE